jgi:hypothetical protein
MREHKIVEYYSFEKALWFNLTGNTIEDNVADFVGFDKFCYVEHFYICKCRLLTDKGKF